MIWYLRPTVNDWVRASRQIKTSPTDHLMDGGIKAGTRGVVTGYSGRQVEVEFETPYGLISATVPCSHLQVTKRGGGRSRFYQRVRVVVTVRLALATFLLYPFGDFTIRYLLASGSMEGIVPAFTLAAMDNLGIWLITAIDNPGQTIVYGIFLAVLGRIAFPK